MSTGLEAIAVFKKASVWGTAVAAGAGDVFWFTSEKVSRTREHLPDDSVGSGFLSRADQGLVACGGDVDCYLRYQGLETLLAMVLGAAGDPARQGETDAYKHTMTMAQDADGLFGTLAMYKGHSVHECAAAKLDGFRMEGSAGKPLTCSFSFICDDLALNTISGQNTVAGLTALTPSEPGKRILFRQGEFLINDMDAAALSAGDAISPSRFSLGVRRGLAGDHLAGGEDRIAEPLAAGFPDLSLSLEFPTYTGDTYLEDLGQDVHKKMSISFTGEEIATGQNYRLTILLPHLVLTNAEASVNSAGKIAHPVTAVPMAPTSAPAGMTGVEAPICVELVNTNTTDPLA